MTPREIIEGSSHVLLDFDGPVCAVFGTLTDRAVAEELRAGGRALGLRFPNEVAQADDPFEVLKFAARTDERAAEQLERHFRACETTAVELAPATPGTPELLKRLATCGKSVTVVSNNSTAAVRRYLERAGLDPFVRGISAREDAKVQRLKPSPYLLRQAMAAAGARAVDCVMIGDSASDIEAARAAGTSVIAYANKPGKRERFATLMPDGLVITMTEL